MHVNQLQSNNEYNQIMMIMMILFLRILLMRYESNFEFSY